MDDFAGTGYFAKEYIVLTQKFNSINFTFGMGWGKFASENNYKNPISILIPSFELRPGVSENLELGGVPLTDTWFKGPVSFFGGFEYYIPNSNGLKLKIENDPFNYFDLSAGNRFDADPNIRKKDSDINIGFSYPINDFIDIDLSYIKGNTFNVSFSIGTSFNKKLKKNKLTNTTIVNNDFKQNQKPEFYRDLLFNLNNNNLFLQTANLDKNNLKVAIQSNESRNHIKQSIKVAEISLKVSELNDIDLQNIEVTNINVGIELNKVNIHSKSLKKYSDNYPTEIIRKNINTFKGKNDDFLKNEFKPTVNFPQVFSTFGPVLVSHVGSPNRFYHGGLEFEFNSEVQFNRNLILNTKLNLNIADNFDDKYYKPDSPFLYHVRTDVLKYLQEGEQYISNMQLDYIWSPYSEVYAKLSFGILEKMYGGYGAEILYKPFKKNYAFGAELFHVKQRTFEQRFDFFKYETNTGHVNFHYFHPKSGIHLKTSYGKYLAKDKGFTVDLSRQTKSGFKAGIFFTRTNVSFEEFGEGSFDKGFYIQIPIDLFSSGPNSEFYNFKLKTLTRDGGAKLNLFNEIFGLINNATYSSINSDWNWYEN